jgi:hypothetical protein
MYQVFTGTGLSNSTVQLPVTSTLSVGWTFNIRNDSIVSVLVNSSGGNLLITIPYGTSATVTCVATGGTTAADWRASINEFSTYTGVGNVVLHGNATIQNPNITIGLLLNNSAGTAGQVLTSAGSGNLPTWTSISIPSNTTLTNPTITNYTETAYTTNSGSGGLTLSLSNGTVQVITLTGVITFQMPSPEAGKSFTVLLKTGTGGYAVTWSSVKWPGNIAPSLTPTANKLDKFVFTSDGTNWYGSNAGQNYSV